MIRKNHYVLSHPWSLVVAVSTTFLAIEIPLRTVLGYSAGPVWGRVDQFIRLLMLVDLAVHVHLSGWVTMPWLPPIKEGGSTAARWWLIVDLLAVVPFGLLRVPPVWELFRLAKLVRIAQMMSHWRHEATHYANVLRLVFFQFWLGLLAHWISCGWVALRGLAPEFDKATHYVRALYWCVTTMATVGYGDITPSTTPQMLYAIVVMILGAGVYGYVIANVATILSNIDPARVRYREMVERLSVFMRYRDIPNDLQKRILDYNAYLWEKRLGYDESAAIAGLPPTLRAEVSLYLNREIISKVPMFRGASEEFIRAVALEMRPVIFTPGDFIMRAGESGSEMYFISRGSVEIMAADGKTQLAKLTAGDFFGEMALLLNQPRMAGARAAEYCDLYVLEKATFKNILARFPDFASHIEEVASKRREQAGAEKS